MTVTITFTGDVEDVIKEIKRLTTAVITIDYTQKAVELNKPIAAEEAKAEPEKKPIKEKKIKEEKVIEPKTEVLPPEKPKYTLQDAIDRAREIAGDGSNEKIMHALKGINTRLGISKVREIPPEKLDGYMRELNAEFPKEAITETQVNMFD